MKHLELHIANTTANTLTEKEKRSLSLKVWWRRHHLLLLTVILGLGYSFAQTNHRDKVDGANGRYPSGESPVFHRCPTDGNLYRSWSEYQTNCPALHRT